MDRRDVVVGLGGLVGTAGLTLGSGAFSAADATREASITVVDDSDGLVGLVPNEAIAGVKTNSGELTIEIGGDEPGVNVDSVYQFGEFVTDDGVSDLTGTTFSVVTSGDPADMSEGQDSLESAFAIVNQSGQDLSVSLDFGLDDDVAEDGTEYAFELQSSNSNGDGSSGEREDKATSPITAELEGDLLTGESFGVSFIVNAIGGTVGDEITGDLSISAESI